MRAHTAAQQWQGWQRLQKSFSFLVLSKNVSIDKKIIRLCYGIVKRFYFLLGTPRGFCRSHYKRARIVYLSKKF